MAMAVALTACGSSSSDSSSASTASSAASSEASSGSKSGETFKIAMLATGPTSAGYGGAHLKGLEQAIAEVEKSSGAGFELTTVENVPFTPQLTQTAQQLFQDGNDLVIDEGTAGEPFYKACEENLDRKCLEGFPLGQRPANTAGYWVDLYSLMYVQGVAAGEVTKTDKTGFVNAIQTPANLALVNAFALGCQSVNPECTVNNIYVNSFTDPPKEVEATTTLVNQGADVIANFMDDSATVKTATGKGAWGFGMYDDQMDDAESHYVTAQVWEEGLSKIFKSKLEELVEGKWETEEIDWGTPEGTLDVKFGPWGDEVPAPVKATAEKVYDEINNGMNPFVGPIEDTTGTVKVPAGEELDPRDPEGLVYNKWEWPVKGVIGG
jgi:basic membrane protein A